VINFSCMRAFVSLLFRLVFTVDSTILTSSLGAAEIAKRWTAAQGVDVLRVQRKKLRRGLWLNARFVEIGATRANKPSPTHRLRADSKYDS